LQWAVKTKAFKPQRPLKRKCFEMIFLLLFLIFYCKLPAVLALIDKQFDEHVPKMETKMSVPF